MESGRAILVTVASVKSMPREQKLTEQKATAGMAIIVMAFRLHKQ